MKTNFKIKNFRVFDENGVMLNLKPLTILTGCNNSGKSSLVKALLLLCDYFTSLKTDKENGKKVILTSHNLNFTKKPNNLLGKFSKVVNRNSKEKSITFEIQVHSLMLTQDVNLELVFSIDETDEEYFNGYISSISIKKLDGTIIYSSSINSGTKGNLNSILPEFIRFVYTQHLISTLQIIDNEIAVGWSENSMSDDEFNELKKQINEYLKEFVKENGSLSLKDINKWNNTRRYRSKFSQASLSNWSFLNEYSRYNPEMIEKIHDTGVLYYLPIFDEKLHGNKTECIEFLTHCINNKAFSRPALWILQKMLIDFKESSFGDFITYYKSWESSYLSDFVMKPSFPSQDEKTPRLFDSRFLSLQCNDILYAPHWRKRLNIDFLEDSKPQKSIEEEIMEWEVRPLDFKRIYEILAMLSEEYVPDNKTYYNRPNGKEYMEYSSRTEWIFLNFVIYAIEEIVVDATPEALSYISSSIINIKRLYPMESDDEFTGLLKRYMLAKRNIDKNTDYEADSFLNYWIREFKIGNKITVEVDKEGLGITLILHKDENDDEGSLLADSGYGITQLFAILLNIEVAIMERKLQYVLPDDCTNPRPTERDAIPVFSTHTIAIEEPEIHLHPNFQSRLADMFVEAYEKYNIHFIIETHSEYLIRKLQLLVTGHIKGVKTKRDDVSIYYVYSEEDKSIQKVKRIGICRDGYLDDKFGEGFYDEATRLSRQLM